MAYATLQKPKSRWPLLLCFLPFLSQLSPNLQPCWTVSSPENVRMGHSFVHLCFSCLKAAFLLPLFQPPLLGSAYVLSPSRWPWCFFCFHRIAPACSICLFTSFVSITRQNAPWLQALKSCLWLTSPQPRTVLVSQYTCWINKWVI